MQALSKPCEPTAGREMTMIIRTYSELITLPTFIERYRYLRLGGRVGEETFGFDRYLNQEFYKKDKEYLKARDIVIMRDHGCDLGCLDREIGEQRIIVHHMNPITVEDIINRTPFLLDPEYMISTVKRTHDAIHYGNEDLLYTDPIVRRKNDTCPWRIN